MFLMMSLLSAAVAAGSSCELPTSSSDVLSAVESIEEAYTLADSGRFAVGQNELQTALNCIEEPLPRYLVAATHRMRGLRAWVERDVISADAAFAAARSIEPDYRFPDTVLPEGHPIRAAYEAAEVSEASTALPEPAAGSYLIDGRRGLQRPNTRAIVLQRLDERGKVVSSSYLFPGDRVILLGPTSVGTEGRTASKRPTAWWIGSASAAAMSLATYGLAATRRSAYEAAPVEDKSILRRQTNGLVLVSAGFGGLALGAGAVALVSDEPALPWTHR